MQLDILPEDIRSLTINLISSLIAFLVGAAVGALWATRRRFRLPRFWRKAFSEKLVLVIGSHDGFSSYEASGLVGVGDAMALAEFVSFFNEVKFSRYEIINSHVARTTDLNENLILIGGADANSISLDFLKRTSSKRKIKFGNPEMNSLQFELDGRVFAPGAGAHETDAAAIVLDENPYARGKYALLVAGCFGHGTWAAAQTLCRDRAFMRNVMKRERFEAALTCEVMGHGPTATSIAKIV